MLVSMVVGSQTVGAVRLAPAFSVANLPVGESYRGRIVNALGATVDGLGSLGDALSTRTIEAPAPRIMDRRSVHEPFATGVTAIDSMIPIGRGQRELIAGMISSCINLIMLNTIWSSCWIIAYTFFTSWLGCST